MAKLLILPNEAQLDSHQFRNPPHAGFKAAKAIRLFDRDLPIIAISASLFAATAHDKAK